MTCYNKDVKVIYQITIMHYVVTGVPVPHGTPPFRKEVQRMDANVLTQIIATVGFPIAACIALGFFVKYVVDKFLSAVADMNEKHEAEQKAMQEVLQANTLAIKEMNITLNQLIQRGVDDGK